MSSQDASAVLAAGAVVWRCDPVAREPVEIALVHRPRYDDWSLPKGKVDADEHLTATAVREVAEETGLRVRLGPPLGEQHYPVTTKDGSSVDKVVSYWAARAGEGRFTPNAEIDDLVWLPVEKARLQLTWERDARLLDAFAETDVETTPLIILRHCHAVSRANWPGTDDDLRPLSPRGVRNAQRLVPVLDAYGVRRVISSPALRCTDSVLPFAGGAGLQVNTAYELTEHGGELGMALAPATVEKLLRSPEPTVLCSHRPLLPDLVAVVGAHASTGLDDSPMAKGEMLVAHVSHGEAPVVVAVERQRG